MNAGEQISLSDLGLWCGKTSAEHCQAELPTEKISESFSKKPQELSIVTPQFLDCRAERVGLMQGAFWETDGLSLGEYTMHSFGEYPKEDVESHLLQILEDNVLPKFFLSVKACLGILKRIKEKNKPIPQILEQALMQQSHSKSEQVVTGGAKESSYNVTEQGPCQQSITNMCSTVAIEGNGQRNSHNGDGYAETDKMYTLNTVERHSVAYSQDAYDKYTETDKAATIKQSGGVYGGGQRHLLYQDVTGPICSRDYKGVGSQYVAEDKIIIDRL